MTNLLIVSNVMLWIAFLGVTIVMLGLLRQVGLLHERSSPMDAMITDHGPDIGDKAPELDLKDHDGRVVKVGGPAADGRQTEPGTRLLSAFGLLHAANKGDPARRHVDVADFRVTTQMLAHAGADDQTLIGLNLEELLAVLQPWHQRLVGRTA
ncbi:methylamine utilization protein MauJ [uncultured Paracoccus sp.]|uniref:methylamine utilization protein MauJ n=1 Tax=uncultured Paracoccus sp. TaxID=189685 RepID=UPI0026086018|nr:methylamine utilization protein MauJ [uncultured Paracoccus sp.]